MYFYLNKPKAETNTLILFKYKNGSEKRFVYSTKINILPKDWDFKAKFIKTSKGRTDLHIIARKLNTFLDFFELLQSNYKIKGLELTHEVLTNEFKNKFEKQNNLLTVIDWFDVFITEKRQLGTSTYKKYKETKNNLIKFEVKNNIELTFKSFIDFKDYIQFAYEELNYIDNTLSRHLRFIKTFLIWAYKKKIHDIRDYSELKIKSYETDHIALTKKQVMELYNYNFDNERLQKVIDVFLIGCFTGQRFSDFSVFDKLDYSNGFIHTRQQKTKAKVMIPVDANKRLKKLLNKYDFDLPKFMPQIFNATLREAVSKLKSFQYEVKKTSYKNGKTIVTVSKFWERVASHSARRTFITLTLEDGWTYKEVMQVSGIKAIQTLMKYDKVSDERLNNKTKKTWA